MKASEGRLMQLLPRAILREGPEQWDPLSYSAEIATAGIICAVLMLIVIALP
jgi:hypothetical protein